MLFNSFDFLYFFPIVIFLYFATPFKYRWVLLLASSYYFYMSWKAEYIILIIISTLVDYFVGINLGKIENPKKRKLLLISSLTVNLGMLIAFKYFNFFSESFSQVIKIFSLDFSAPSLKLLLPVGISFYTFQTLSYTIDVYRKKIKPEKHLGIFAVYVSFFPQLVAGPIERAGNLLPQFFQKHNLEYNRITSGLRRMLWGFFKKIVIADRLAIVVNIIFINPHEHSGLSLILASFFFTWQIYCDFSGYSDIAIGAAQVMGFKLMENFKHPFSAKSIADFWNRWHISMTSWFQDYVFVPLYVQMSRIKTLKKLVAQKRHTIAFILSTLLGLSLLGLWHGANWTFVFFGLYHGTMIIVYHLTKKKWDKMITPLQVIFTFIIVVIGNIFFRANSLGDSFYMISHLFSNAGSGFFTLPVGQSIIINDLLLIGLLGIIQFFQKKHNFNKIFLNFPPFLRWATYTVAIIAILLFGVFDDVEFIYFQF
jgi:alginate O-acetyltransferase complex protein AlgI